LNDYELVEYDQLKIVLRLSRSEWVNWKEYKEKIEKICEYKKWVLKGIKVEELETSVKQSLSEKSKGTKSVCNREVFDNFCVKNKVSKNIKQIGESILNA